VRTMNLLFTLTLHKRDRVLSKPTTFTD